MDILDRWLDQLRESHRGLFDSSAFETAEDSRRGAIVEVDTVSVPWGLEFERRREDDALADEEWSYEDQLDSLFRNEVGISDDAWPELEFELWDTEDSDRRRDELEGYENGRSRVGLELLAIYLPFHFYPRNSWGVRFFERPLLKFSAQVYANLRGFLPRPERLSALRLATYSIARHEFNHFLTELLATDIELKGGRRQYRPY